MEHHGKMVLNLATCSASRWGCSSTRESPMLGLRPQHITTSAPGFLEFVMILTPEERVLILSVGIWDMDGKKYEKMIGASA